jgi:hypothetical protein
MSECAVGVCQQAERESGLVLRIVLEFGSCSGKDPSDSSGAAASAGALPGPPGWFTSYPPTKSVPWQRYRVGFGALNWWGLYLVLTTSSLGLACSFLSFCCLLGVVSKYCIFSSSRPQLPFSASVLELGVYLQDISTG